MHHHHVPPYGNWTLFSHYNSSHYHDQDLQYGDYKQYDEESWPPTQECPAIMKLFDLDFFHLYYIPTIISVGLVGNLLSCVVFLRTHLKMRSSSYYLAALATADFGFNVTLLLVWLSGFGLRVFNEEGWCQGVVYFSSVCSFLSVWLIVAFTVERFIAVQYPLHRPHMCTVERAKAVVSLLAALALLLHCYSFFTASVRLSPEGGDQICEMNERYREAMRVINIVDTVLTLIVPLALIVVMNTMITRNLLRFGKRLQQQNNQSNPPPTPQLQSDFNLNQINSSSSTNKICRGPSQQSFHSSNRAATSSSSHVQMQAQTVVTTRLTNATTQETPPQATRCIHIRSSRTNLVSTKTQQSITKMLLLISTVFVMLNLPSYVIRLYVFVCFSLWRQEASNSLWCMQQFFMLLYYTNFSINFLLYSMCGITFRRCLWQLIRNKLKALTRHKCFFLRQRS
ncbi:uncharacterized protein LOC111058990 [Nilaparvata lugens]|uniref:uncharacterized protein LOC111058990 n=1 Tax=Nilaparvata lugens TaxID=108931 RepID=UPI00193D58A6|nr:uncharacterized protein LOC111058990 [Nilaparvata lugens]